MPHETSYIIHPITFSVASFIVLYLEDWTIDQDLDHMYTVHTSKYDWPVCVLPLYEDVVRS